MYFYGARMFRSGKPGAGCGAIGTKDRMVIGFGSTAIGIGYKQMTIIHSIEKAPLRAPSSLLEIAHVWPCARPGVVRWKILSFVDAARCIWRHRATGRFDKIPFVLSCSLGAQMAGRRCRKQVCVCGRKEFYDKYLPSRPPL